jgi:hypothetical protein
MTDVRGWSITWAGATWSDENCGLTSGDVCRLQVLVGDGWESCDPWKSPLHLASMIAVLLARDTDADPLAVLMDVVNPAPAEELLSALSRRAVVKAA